MKVSQYLINQAKKAGVTITPEDLVIIEALEGDVPPTAVNLIDAKLMTIDAAEANPTLKNKLKAEALNAVDVKLEALLDTVGATEDQKTAIKAITGSYNKIDEAGKLIKTILDEKGAGTAKGKEADLIAKLDKANGDLAKMATDHAAALAAKDAEVENKINAIELGSLFVADDFGALPAETPEAVKKAFAQSIFDKELANSGYILKRVDGKLELREADGSKVYSKENNLEVNLTDFKTRVLDQNKVRKVSDIKTETTEVKLPEGQKGLSKHISGSVNQMEAEAMAELNLKP